MPGDRIPHSVLPPAEIGTAQQELTMLRHHLSVALIKAAHVVAKDQSKEKIQAFVRNARVKIAKAIEPND